MSGRKSGLVTRKAASAAKRPFSVMPPKIEPPSRGPVPLAFTATAMSTGTSARITSSARLRRRRNIMPTSERRNLAGDIEPLPGEVHELLLQARPLHADTAHCDAGRDHRGDDALRGDVPCRGRHRAVRGPHVDQPEFAQPPARGLP